MCGAAHYAEPCDRWLALLRRKAQFSLHISEEVSILPHSKEMKVQAGGIIGLYKLLEIEPGDSNLQPNVFELLEICNDRTGNLESLPFSEIIREIVHFRPR